MECFSYFAIPISAIITALATTCLAIFTLKLLTQLELAKDQLNTYNRWNKLNATFSYYNYERFGRYENELKKELDKIFVEIPDTFESLRTEVIKKIWNRRDAKRALENYLSLYEEYSCALKYDVIDHDISYDLFSHKLCKLKHNYITYINYLREMQEDNKIYCELLKLANSWYDKFKVDRKSNN